MSLVDRDPDRLIGTILGGRFVIKQCVAVDDAGARYEAWDDQLTSDASVRTLHRVRPDDASVRKLVELLTEVSSLGIRGIAPLRAVGRTREKDVYYATEPVTGEALSELLAGGAIEPAEAVKAVAAAGDVLAECHAKGVVHGGLHPGAVILPVEGAGARVSLVDFGLGPITRAPDALAAGAASASMPYQSPEQASGEPYDHRADVYSLGALLYVALTGRPPFAGSSVLEVLAHQLRGEAPSLAKASPDLEGSPLQSVIDQSMQVKPAERFDSVGAMVRALRLAGKEDAARKRAPRASTASRAAQAAAADETRPQPRRPAGRQKPAGPYRGAPSKGGVYVAEKAQPVWPYIVGGLVIAAAFGLYYGWGFLGLGTLAAATERLVGGATELRQEAPPPAAPADAGQLAPVQPAPPPPRRPGGRDDETPPALRPLTESAQTLLAEANEALAAGQAVRAVSRFRAAAREAPDSPIVARGLGLALEASGDRRGAVVELRRYLELDPSAADARAMRARIASLEQR